MKLIIGLGNPGKNLEKTRHNYGFKFIEILSKQFEFSDFELNEKFQSEISEGKIKNEKVILAKPQTMMNASGRATALLTKFYKIKSKDIIITHDDVDIPFGNFKISFGKNAAGHRGVESILKVLKTIDVTRIRLGTQPGKKKVDAMKLVLGKFTPTQQKALPKIIKKAIEQLSMAFK
ncbi:MAG: aminoacyl-tRNA hydrolase [Candidatus Portnoybacteria bacterium CG10_big_fil_rev_8_21_14_0_10_36_7]|uniref:Aminoacyl-tRNA hydrolase n=1 Tax=Candidatus Portnoybacteria bacterium CG10_big_fil_rev_8_21_14_0_10_36_7 TaxID=1974812 RepID=A0A2M8KE85_9BACT|nr:MAG: aminoacyl-tRNA hydrolase [Candidatus Portnoybacteria bacterium CG10_big_fil_rev_8_21_14_0_10_36_7]